MKKHIKNNILIAMALLLFVAVLGVNQAEAQTKEETIRWVKENLEKYAEAAYGDDGITNVHVSPCNISYREENVCEFGSIGYIDISFNPSEVKSWTSTSKNALKADSEVIREIYMDMVVEFGDVDYLDTILLKNEGDVHQRMIKALLHLATFCDEE